MFPFATKILVIDDFANMRKIIKKTLSDLGYNTVDEADDGATAWPMIENAYVAGSPYGFIISDWNMPNLKGIDLLKACRSDKRFKNIPFILVTVESEKEQIINAANSGVSNYIVKPFTSELLIKKMERVWQSYSQINE